MKITLLGDSIRMQYQARVGELLGEGYDIFAPSENCRFAKHTLRGIFEWSGQMKESRIVHWNNGLWDICDLFGDGCFTNKKEYLENILRIADILLAKYDKVIFATNTPVTDKNVYNRNSDIIEYNKIIAPELIRRGIIINDLHAPVYADIDRYICNDNIHLTPEGIELCAGMVANAIRNAASELGDISERSSSEPTDTTGAPVII